MLTCTEELSDWVFGARRSDIPDIVAHATTMRVLNYFGVVLAASGRDYGASVRGAAVALGASGPCHILGFGDEVIASSAALANGTMASALAFDDSQTETLIHVTATTASVALALGQQLGASGADALEAIALGNEVICRIGAIAPGQFHKHGFHPTGIVGAFGAAFTACRMLGLSRDQMVQAAGIVGTMASGSNECWRDGSWAQIVDPGWAAQAGMTAARLAQNGFSGPPRVIEGQFGLFQSHIQDVGRHFDFERCVRDLGRHWESRHVSIKPYPCGHVSIPFVDCALDLYNRGIRADRIRQVICHVPAWIAPVVCEPIAEKRRPTTDWHCRVSLPFTVAEAIVTGRLDAGSYAVANRSDPHILALADRVSYDIDDSAPMREEYKGWVTVELVDGTTAEALHMHGRDDHMSDEAVATKFLACLNGLPFSEQRAQDLLAAVRAFDHAPSITPLTSLATFDRLPRT